MTMKAHSDFHPHDTFYLLDSGEPFHLLVKHGRRYHSEAEALEIASTRNWGVLRVTTGRAS